MEHFWSRLVASGDIYKGTHVGWYSVSDECFYSASQVIEKEGKMVAIETGNDVIWEEEMNWKFKLGKWKERLIEWASRPGGESWIITNAILITNWKWQVAGELMCVPAIQPALYQQEVLAQLDNLNDLSISRPASRVKWGVSVPGDPEQTIYVWVDALVNYATVAGYPGQMDGWPADVHLVGKDIIR